MLSTMKSTLLTICDHSLLYCVLLVYTCVCAFAVGLIMALIWSLTI